MDNWYQDILSLKGFIDKQNWPYLHTKCGQIMEIVTTEAFTAKKPLYDLYIASKKPFPKEKIEKLYKNLLIAAQKEKNTSTYDRVLKEEEFFDRLSQITINVNISWRIFLNYWRGTRAKDFNKWLELKREYDVTPLTKIGRHRLNVRHQALSDRITPSFTKMAVQLWPIALLWIIKKASVALASYTVKATIEKRKAAKEIDIVQKKLKAGSKKSFSLASLKKINE